VKQLAPTEAGELARQLGRLTRTPAIQELLAERVRAAWADSTARAPSDGPVGPEGNPQTVAGRLA